MDGGGLQTEGDITITTATITAGDWICNNHRDGGDALTTLNATGGTIDGSQSYEPRTWATVNIKKDASLKLNDKVTITTLSIDPEVTRIDAR
jgi:hypothetical protein